jgi:hypothetical protein
MTDIDTKRLRELAEAATPDAAEVIHAIRRAVEFYVANWYAAPGGGDGILKEDGPVGRMLALLTAANPQAVIALLDSLKDAAWYRDRYFGNWKDAELSLDACKKGAADMVARVQEESKRHKDQLAAANAEIERLRDLTDKQRQVHNEYATEKNQQLAAMTKARDEACDGWETAVDQSDYPHGTFAELRRAEIAALRKVGAE